MVFNILVYNNDDHLRNFGFLASGTGAGNTRWNLSPLYDVVPATVHSETRVLAMKVGEEGKKASIKNALSQCERYHLSHEESFRLVEEMKSIVSSWREHFKECGVTEKELRVLENSFVLKD
jgi:serine/threonine-protein kinase HipA